MTSVLVADAEHLVRAGLCALLEGADGLAVAGEAADGLSAVTLARRQRPDVVLMHIRMPGIDGAEATRRLAMDPDLAGTKVVLTMIEHDEFVFDALRHGAQGLVLTDAPPSELERAVRVVAEGGAFLSPLVLRTVVRELVARSPRSPISHPGLRTLTEREREVLGLVAEGLDNHEIAARLVVSPATSRTHVSRVMTKLGARDRAQLVAFAHQSGFVGAPMTA